MLGYAGSVSNGITLTGNNILRDLMRQHHQDEYNGVYRQRRYAQVKQHLNFDEAVNWSKDMDKQLNI